MFWVRPTEAWCSLLCRPKTVPRQRLKRGSSSLRLSSILRRGEQACSKPSNMAGAQLILIHIELPFGIICVFFPIFCSWVILNRDNPMATIGKQVLNHDRIMLEQEWYFLASSSPTNSIMYKSVDNSDDAMTTKLDLFKPSEDCIWRVRKEAILTSTDDYFCETILSTVI